MLNIGALERTSVHTSPFPYLVVPNFIDAANLDGIEKDYPRISKPGSFPLESLRFGSQFSGFMTELRAPKFRDAIADKLGIELRGKPTTVTVRGQAREKDGQIHLDSKSKLVTVLLYMNGKWEADGGRLRLLNSPGDLDDMVMEVPPAQGTLLAFLNTPNAWHGHKPFQGERRVIQLNWVRDRFVVWREKSRHSVSAFFKQLKG